MTDYINLANRLKQSHAGHDCAASTALREAADAIEALQSDRDQLQRDFTYMKQQRDALQAENERLNRQWAEWSDSLDSVMKQRNALQAKLDELAKQEPVGFVAPHELKDLKEGFPITVILFSSHKRISPLYAAPKALEPLTDEQIHDLSVAFRGGADWSEEDFETAELFARAIEAAHGITKGTP